MEQMETAPRLAGCSFDVSGVPLWGKLRASMEQMETAPRLAGCSFDVSGVPFWGKLRASMEQMETAQRPAGRSFGLIGVPFWGKLKAQWFHPSAREDWIEILEVARRHTSRLCRLRAGV